MSERKSARELDRALHGAEASDEARDLTETAGVARRALATDVPPADRQRALFVAGVGGRDRSRFPVARLLVPAMAVVALLLAIMASRGALPGEELYPVRKALNAVGLAETPLVELEDHLNKAARLLHDAEQVVVTDSDRAVRLAVAAIEELGLARELLVELDEQRAAKLSQIENLEDRAVVVISRVSLQDQVDDDSSGPGSGDEDRSGSNEGTEDNSGPGSDDDSSGPGSGSDTDDDSSGSGSGSDDSSGSGSGSDDSSGSGSGSGDSSGSGSGDSSGSGSSDGDSSGPGSDPDDD